MSSCETRRYWIELWAKKAKKNDATRLGQVASRYITDSSKCYSQQGPLMLPSLKCSHLWNIYLFHAITACLTLTITEWCGRIFQWWLHAGDLCVVVVGWAGVPWALVTPVKATRAELVIEKLSSVILRFNTQIFTVKKDGSNRAINLA